MSETTNRSALIASLKVKAASLRREGGDDPTDTETLLLDAADALAAQDDAIMSAQEKAWDEGHETWWDRGPDDCDCDVNSWLDCGCDLYGTGELLSLAKNPYRG